MHETSRRLRFFSLLALAAAAQGCTRPDGAVKALPGDKLFAACTSCHGNKGEGNHTVAAPAIAGLPAWYVEAQLVKFRTGARGAHPDDFEGLRMRPMSRQMMDEGEVKSVAAYVASMPAAKAAPTLQGGDATAGQAAYGTCSACHGAQGQGNEAMKAPPIAGQADWYLLTQLKKFKAGVRGANALDASGGTMRPMAMLLADEQAMKNVVAHISTMAR